jgi:hypothetical protein
MPAYEKSLPADGKLPPILPVVLYNGDGRWAAPLSMHELVGLPSDSPLWPWQPTMRYEVVDEGAFAEGDLARRDALVALLFRLENLRQPEQLDVLVQALVAWFRRHPGYEALQAVFVSLLGALMAPLAPGVRMPEELSEFTNMLATKPEIWKRAWLEEGEQKGRLEGRQEGEVALLRRQLERRFGALPGWAVDRIAAADTAVLEEWGLRVLDAGGLEDILA